MSAIEHETRSTSDRRGVARLRAVLRVAAVVAISALAAEIAVRVAADWVPGVRTLARPTGARVRDPETFAEFQRAYRDHLAPYRELYGFRCNSLGFHDLEFLPSLPPGGVRIVALGDSFAYGTVPYGHGYLTLLEAFLLLDRQRGGATAPLVVDNLGVPASGIADYRLVYSFVGRDLAPDLVLVTLYLGNDPRDYADDARFGRERRLPDSYLLTFLRRATRLAREPGFALESDAVARGAGATAGGVVEPGLRFTDDSPELRRPVFSAEAIADVLQGELAVLARPGAPLERPDWDAFAAALTRLLQEVHRDASVVLVLAPSRLQVHPAELRAAADRAGVRLADLDVNLPNRRIASLARRLGVPVIDTTRALRRHAASGERLYRPNDTHWSLRGNAVAAEVVAGRLVELGLVPLATASDGSRADSPLPAPRHSA